jgi:diaminopimelate epimerase
MTPPQIEFFKMSAAGNDFILLDNRSGTLGRDDFPDLVRRLCTRALSVGADGVILLEPSSVANLRVSFFNPDGKPTFCGNGARCASRLAFLQGIAPARMTIETSIMVHRAEVKGASVSFEMRDPQGFDDAVEVPAGNETIRGVFVDTGVPHFVVFRTTPATESIDTLGRILRRHPRFAPSGGRRCTGHPYLRTRYRGGDPRLRHRLRRGGRRGGGLGQGPVARDAPDAFRGSRPRAIRGTAAAGLRRAPRG